MYQFFKPDDKFIDNKTSKLKIQNKIPHPGEINRARYCPQDPDIIACCANNG